MTIYLLMRHAAYDFGVRHLAGRSEWSLSADGQAQANALAHRGLPRRVTLVHSSPRARCLQTIAPYSAATGQPAAVRQALDEVDFGNWTGLEYSALENDPHWRNWNERRGEARAPAGESMSEAQARIVRHLKATSRAHPSGTIVVVTHAELIRAVVLHCLSLPLNSWQSVDVPYASVRTVAVGSSGQMIVDQKVAA
jgi:broad specificity phosphatase PhoE